MTAMDYAPAGAARPRRGQTFVLYTGLITTALTLFGVYYLNTRTDDFNIMGWYANYVLPVGALLVGLAAGSGYGIGSAISGKKISKQLLLAVLALQVVAYFVAQYIEFRQLDLVYQATGQAVGFWEYFHESAMSFAWKQKSGGMGEALGMWGYAFRALEVAGFALGGLVVPGVMMARPYCDGCQRYKKTRELAFIPASVPARKVKKDDAAGQAAYEAERQAAMAAAEARHDRLVASATGGDAAAFRADLAELAPGSKQAQKLPRRIRVAMITCPGCNTGTLETSAVSGTGDKVAAVPLASTELTPEFVRALGHV